MTFLTPVVFLTQHLGGANSFFAIYSSPIESFPCVTLQKAYLCIRLKRDLPLFPVRCGSSAPARHPEIVNPRTLMTAPRSGLPPARKPVSSKRIERKRALSNPVSNLCSRCPMTAAAPAPTAQRKLMIEDATPSRDREEILDVKSAAPQSSRAAAHTPHAARARSRDLGSNENLF